VWGIGRGEDTLARVAGQPFQGALCVEATKANAALQYVKELGEWMLVKRNAGAGR